jgi:hypothetical protein
MLNTAIPQDFSFIFDNVQIVRKILTFRRNFSTKLHSLLSQMRVILVLTALEISNIILKLIPCPALSDGDQGCQSSDLDTWPYGERK